MEEDKNIKMKKFIQNKIEEIKTEGAVNSSSESDYQQELNNKQLNLLKLKRRFDSLALSQSLETKYNREKLQQQISDLEKEIQEMQEAYTRQLRIENLQKQLEQYK